MVETIELEVGGETIEMEFRDEIVNLYENVVMPEINEPFSFDRLVAEVIRGNQTGISDAVEEQVLSYHQDIRRQIFQRRQQAKQIQQITREDDNKNGGIGSLLDSESAEEDQ